MDNELKYKWKDIYIWSENNQVKKVKTIEEALKQGKAGYYVVCDEKNNVYGTGVTVLESLEDFFFSFLQQGNIQNLLKFESIPPFSNNSWNLHPTIKGVITYCEYERCKAMMNENEIIPLSFCQNNIVCKINQGMAFIDGEHTKFIT